MSITGQIQNSVQCYWPSRHSYPGEFPALDKLKSVQKLPKLPKHDDRHHLFSAGMKVTIKEQFKISGDCNESALNAFKRYRGQDTIIQCMYSHCCTLQVDGGHWAWSFDWIDPIIPNHLDKELFEI